MDNVSAFRNYNIKTTPWYMLIFLFFIKGKTARNVTYDKKGKKVVSIIDYHYKIIGKSLYITGITKTDYGSS